MEATRTWPGKLCNDRREFFLTNCIGIELFLKPFGASPDRDILEEGTGGLRGEIVL
jgi:hypothetical protein